MFARPIPPPPISKCAFAPVRYSNPSHCFFSASISTCPIAAIAPPVSPGTDHKLLLLHRIVQIPRHRICNSHLDRNFAAASPFSGAPVQIPNNALRLASRSAIWLTGTEMQAAARNAAPAIRYIELCCCNP